MQKFNCFDNCGDKAKKTLNVVNAKLFSSNQLIVLLWWMGLQLRNDKNA